MWSPALAVFSAGARDSLLEGIETNFATTQNDTGWGGGEKKKRKSQILGNGRCPALLLTLQQAATWPRPSICRCDSLGELPSALALSGGRHQPRKNTLFFGVVSDILFLYDNQAGCEFLIGAELPGIKMHKGALFWGVGAGAVSEAGSAGQEQQGREIPSG